MIEFLLHHAQNVGNWAYPVLFVAMAFEGDLVLLTTGFLIRIGALDPALTMIALFSGTMVGDYGWYLFGRHARKFRWKWLERLYVATRFAEKHLLSKLTRTLCIAKFVYGLHRPTCFRCGSLHMPQRVFLEANIVASILWIITVSSIGYLAGYSFMIAKHYLKYAEIGVLIFILVLVGIMHFASRKYKKNNTLDI